MVVYQGNKYEMRHHAFLRAVRFFGGVTTFSRTMGIDPSRGSKWLNQSWINIPYEYLLLTAALTQSSIDLLSPFTETANQLVKSWHFDKHLPLSIPMNRGFVKNDPLRYQAFLEAIDACGGEAAYSRKIRVGPSRVSKWVKYPRIKIPYQYLLMTAAMTGISIERLSPSTVATNQLVKNGCAAHSRLPISIPTNRILVENMPILGYLNPERPIIIDTDGALISGLAQLQVHQAAGIQNLSVIRIDVKGLLLGMPMEDKNAPLLFSERMAVGVRLKRLLKGRQGQRTDLTRKQVKGSQGTHILDEVVGRTDAKIAHILGFSKGTYRYAEQVQFHGVPELFQALDHKKISISRAARIAQLSKEDQRAYVQDVLTAVKRNVRRGTSVGCKASAVT